MNRIIKDYITKILLDIMNTIQMKNNPFETSIGSGDIENIFDKIIEEINRLPEDYLEILFAPILKK